MMKSDLLFQSYHDEEDIFNTITDMITIHDKDFNIIKANNAARKTLKLHHDKKSELKCFKYYHGKEAPPECCPSCICIKTGRPSCFELFEPHLKMFIEIRAIPRFNRNNQLIGLIHIVRDISERKAIEESLKKTREELRIQTEDLMETNAALKVLLKQREKDKSELEEKVLFNIKTLVMPYIKKLKSESFDLNYLDIVETNLNEIISPFSIKLSSNYAGLTPKEIQVANLIKEGKQSKEIAGILHLSFETVNCHRQNIRKKLGVTNKKTNLRNYLSSLLN